MKGYASSERCRAYLGEEKIKEVLDVTYERARRGDMAAAKIILDGSVPVPSPVELPVVMSPLTGTLPQQGEALLAAMTRGEIAPAQCAQLLLGFGAHARAVEIDAMTRRLTALEKLFDERDAKTQPESR